MIQNRYEPTRSEVEARERRAAQSTTTEQVGKMWPPFKVGDRVSYKRDDGTRTRLGTVIAAYGEGDQYPELYAVLFDDGTKNRVEAGFLRHGLRPV